MRRNSIIQIVALLAAVLVLVLVLIIRRSGENHDKLKPAPISRFRGDQAQALQTSSGRSLSAPGSPANLRFAHLSVADGLSHNDVRAIAQDRQGFMWFGTWLGGLNRYDGYTFKVYKHDDQDSRSLGCDRIWALYVDRTGVLWVGTYEGIDRYDQDTDSFVHYRLRADDPSARPAYDARSFMEDESGALWVTSSGGLNRFDRASGRFVTYGQPSFPPSVVDTDIWSMCLDRTTGSLWLGTVRDGVSVLDRATGQYTTYKSGPDNASLGNNQVQHIYQDRAGTLWFSTVGGGLNRFDPRTHGFVRYLHDPKNPASLSDDYVKMSYEDRAGRFWVATNNGLNLMDRARGTFTPYLHDPNDSSSLGSNVISSRALYVDSSGALWIGTRSAGVDRLAGEPPKLTTYRHNASDVNSLGNDVITGLSIGSGGELWIGTEAGLDRFDGKTFTHYVASPNDPRRLTPGPERSVAQDQHGTVWTATLGGGVDRLEGQRVQHLHHDPSNSDSPGNDVISSLVPDTLGGLWMGVHRRGVDYFDGLHFTHFPRDPADPASRLLEFVRSMLLDRNGILWIGTSSSGLARLDTHTEKLTTYLMDPKQLGSQAANYVEDVYSDGTSLWIASGVGLFRFDPEAGKFTRHYTESDGLANNAVVGVLGDEHGDLWVSTIKGLSRFDPRTERFRNYDVFDGLQANEFSPRARAKAPDGRLFFGGVRGLSAFYPDKLVDNPNPPAVVLTEFELFNNPVKIGGEDSPLQRAIQAVSSITLRHDQSVFRFQFAALDFTAPQKNRYAYKLERFDRDWQYTDAARRFATYTNLDPGDYTFRVKASNNDGVWNEQGVALRIRILPPLWNTWWFRSLCTAAFLALLWTTYQVRTGQLREHERKLREVVETIPVATFTALPDGSNTFVSSLWTEFTGLSAEETAGAGWQKAIHPEDLERHSEKWRISIKTGQPFEDEARLRRASDGRYHWFLARAVPLRDRGGKILRWYGTLTDIEARKNAEEALRRGEAYLAEAQKLTHTGCWAWDPHHDKMLYCSEEVYSIYEFDPQQGLPSLEELTERVHPEDRDRVRESTSELAPQRVEHLLEFRIVLPDGTVKYIQSVRRPVLNEAGAVVEVVGTSIDVTERKRVEAERERLSQIEADLAHINRVSVMGEMAASIAHEISQPLTAIATQAAVCLRWLTAQPPHLAQVQQATEKIARDSSYAGEVIQRVRKLFRRAVIEKAELDLNEVIDEALDLLGAQIAKRHVALRRDLEDISHVVGDRVQLEQLIINLVLNGLEAMDNSGLDHPKELVVRSRQESCETVIVEVHDTGAGLQDPERIFEPFFTTKKGGTGLGLSVCRSIIKAHGGNLLAVSGEGAGTTFRFTLPVRHSEPS